MKGRKSGKLYDELRVYNITVENLHEQMYISGRPFSVYRKQDLAVKKGLASETLKPRTL